MSIRLSDLTIRDGLVIVDLNGYEPERETATDEATRAVYDVSHSLNRQGDANWLCDAYGMCDDDHEGTGILHTDYDSSSSEPWRFSVLLDAEESEDFQKVAKDAGYDVLEVKEVAEPLNYGDGNGTVEILKHREGWVILGG